MGPGILFFAPAAEQSQNPRIRERVRSEGLACESKYTRVFGSRLKELGIEEEKKKNEDS